MEGLRRDKRVERSLERQKRELVVLLDDLCDGEEIQQRVPPQHVHLLRQVPEEGEGMASLVRHVRVGHHELDDLARARLGQGAVAVAGGEDAGQTARAWVDHRRDPNTAQRDAPRRQHARRYGRKKGHSRCGNMGPSDPEHCRRERAAWAHRSRCWPSSCALSW